MSFAEFAARYSPLKPPPALVVRRRRGKGPYRRKTKSGFHIGDRIMTRYHGEQTVRSIRGDLDWDGSYTYYVYTTNNLCLFARECERVV